MIDSIIVETIARTCHEANRAYCISLGDLSQPSWEQAPDWQKDSARNGVRMHLSKAPYEVRPQDSHENWYAEKAANGWKYGPVKDASKKEHPCMVAYEALPDSQKLKDNIFKGIVDSFRDYIPYGIEF